jgi:GntR family transcriptional regulator
MPPTPDLGQNHDDRDAWLRTLTVRRGAAPLHRQIHRLVRTGIEEGRLASGTQLPSEGNLAAGWGVSVAPVRHALLDLTSEGYLERGQGRGTFVRSPKIEEKLSILSSFSNSPANQASGSQIKMISSGLVPTLKEIAEALGTGRRRLTLIQRVASIGGSPVALLSAYLDPLRFPGIEKGVLDGGSLYRTLANSFGVELVRAQTVLEATNCGDEEAGLLGLRPGTTVLRVDSTTYNQDDVPVEYSRVLYHMDRFTFSLESHRFDDRIIHVPTNGRSSGGPAVPGNSADKQVTGVDSISDAAKGR